MNGLMALQINVKNNVEIDLCNCCDYNIYWDKFLTLCSVGVKHRGHSM